jgi:hypothetical protein
MDELETVKVDLKRLYEERKRRAEEEAVRLSSGVA